MIRRVVGGRTQAVALPPISPERPWTVAESFSYCERMARDHYENFPVASRFVPAELRPHVWAIYAFARTADDFADEPRYAGRRHEKLDEWEDRLEAAFHGEADHPVFVALAETARARNVPISPLRDLLTAFRMDLAVQRHATFASVKNYCVHSAHPVGRLVLYVFDYRDANLHRYSDDLCTALQLTNFLQDVGLDYARGRIYLPEEDLLHFGVSEKDIEAGRVTGAFRDLMRFEVARARALFERGRPLADKVGADLSFELDLIWHGGTTILDKIEAVGFDVFRRRPVLNRADKIRMVAKSAARRWPARRAGRERA
jgi:squalene synthase HpnC